MRRKGKSETVSPRISAIAIPASILSLEAGASGTRATHHRSASQAYVGPVPRLPTDFYDGLTHGLSDSQVSDNVVHDHFIVYMTTSLRDRYTTRERTLSNFALQ